MTDIQAALQEHNDILEQYMSAVNEALRQLVRTLEALE